MEKTTIQTIKEAESLCDTKYQKQFFREALLAVFESELEEIKKMKWGSPYINGDFTHNNEDAYHYNLAIKDISSHLTEVINYLKQK